MRRRSSFRQKGHPSCVKRQRVVQREQISKRSAAGVITEKSGSPPHSGQFPKFQPAKVVLAITASAQRERNGRIACTNSGSSPAISAETGPPPAGTGRAISYQWRTAGASRSAARDRFST